MPLRPALLALLCVACSGETDGGVRSGDYQFYTLAVEDSCLDGALEAVFMPQGPDSPHPFEFPVFLPAPDQAPLTYDVDFRAPFVGMTITIEADGDGLRIEDSVMPAVRVDADRYGDCDVTITVDADLAPAGTDTLAGTASLALSNPRGSDGRCPPFDADPCTLELTLRADFQQARDTP